MGFIFLPSLQHLAAVKIALCVYYDDIIKLSENSIFLEETHEKSCVVYKNKWVMVQKDARVKLTNLLPELLQQRVIQLIQPLSSEIQIWITNHAVVDKHAKKYCAENFCWRSEGTIDRIKTAKNFIGNQKIDIRVRFIIACIYCMEFEIMSLWCEMGALKRIGVPRLDCNIVVRFWIRRLKKRDHLPWTQAICDYLDPNEHRNTDSRFRLSSFYTALDKRTRWIYISQLWPWVTHVDDLVYCIYQMDETERYETLRKIPTKVLNCYLRWPLQSLFLDIVNTTNGRLSANCCEALLHIIAKKKVMQDLQDFDYLKLYQDMWDGIPDEKKEIVKPRRTF